MGAHIAPPAAYTQRVVAGRPRVGLGGVWAFRTDPDGVGRQAGYWKPDLDDEPWSSMPVPSHWQAEGLDYQGIAWYRRRLGPYTPGAGRRAFLVFDGVDYRASVWLNGVHLGDHEGGYFGFEFDVTDLLEAGGPNVLAVEVDCPMNANPEAKRVVKGAISHWDCIPVRQGPLPPFTDDPWYPHPVLNPAGIWGSVYIEERPLLHFGPVQVATELGALEAGQAGEAGEATVHVRAPLRNLTGARRRARLGVRIAPDNFEGGREVEEVREVPIGAGESEIEVSLRVPEPRLWWSWDQGFPSLYRIELRLMERGDAVLDAVATRFGLREVRRGPNWELYLNGRRFFSRGTNYLSRLFMSQATPELYRRHLGRVRELGMNLVRVFAHVELPEFYDLCDEMGILVYQDLPFQWGYDQSPEVRRAALELAEQTVCALRNHPSVIIWCCHSEPRLPDWLGLTRAVYRRVQELDPSRILIKASIFAPTDGLSNEEQGEEAFEAYHRTSLTVPWVGWYWDRIEDVEKYAPHFVSEVGAQGLPGVESLREMLPERALWPPDWEAWKRHGFQLEVYRQNLGDPPGNLEAFVARSQAYQARLLKSHVEAFRRKKYRPTNGVVQFTLTDCAPMISWSVVDFFDRPKPAYEVLRRVMQPVLVSIQARSESRVGAAPIDVNLWLINDYPHGFPGCRLSWEVVAPGGERLTSGQRLVDVPPDTAEGGAARFTLRFARPGTYAIRASLQAADGRILADNEALVQVGEGA